MRKSDLFASVSHYALGRMGLNHYNVARERARMNSLVEEAEAQAKKGVVVNG